MKKQTNETVPETPAAVQAHECDDRGRVNPALLHF